MRVTHAPTGRVVTVRSGPAWASIAKLRRAALTILRSQLAAGGDGTGGQVVREYDGDMDAAGFDAAIRERRLVEP